MANKAGHRVPISYAYDSAVSAAKAVGANSGDKSYSSSLSLRRVSVCRNLRLRMSW